MECQPHLKGECIAAIELDTLNNQSTLDSCFLELKCIHVVNKFGDKHWEIYNIEEMGIPLDHHSNSRRARKSYVLSYGEQVSNYCFWTYK